MSKQSRKNSRAKSAAKRAKNRPGETLRAQARQKHREMMEKLKNPQVGVKPPDPIVPKTESPGSGVDEWRDSDSNR